MGSPENMLPNPRNTAHLGLHAITRATLTILVQVVFYAIIIICTLSLVSFLVECSGWIWESKRKHKERGETKPPRTPSKARSKSCYSEGSQKRSKPTQELRERKPRPGVQPKPKSQDQFDNVLDHDSVILRTPDSQSVPHSFKTLCWCPNSPSLMLVIFGQLISPMQWKCLDLEQTLKPSLQRSVSAGGVDGPHPKASLAAQ